MDESNRSVSVPLIVAVLLGVLVLAAIFFLGNPSQRPSAPKVPEKLPPLGSLEQQYSTRIGISDLRLSQFENFLGQTVTYVEGVLSNRGNRSLAAVELTFEFKDVLNQTVLRETVRVVGRRTSPLGPGLARSFRVGFDHIPADWNRRPPEIRVTGLLLE